MLRKDFNESVHYTAVLPESAVLNVSELAGVYNEVLTRSGLTALIVDFRASGPLLQPHDYEEFFGLTGENWSNIKCLVYIYSADNRMRAAHVTKLIHQRGVHAVATSSWEKACEALDMELGEDPLKEAS